MEKEIEERLKSQQELLEEIYTSVEKTRKYFLLTFWITIAMFILPAIGLIFVIPSFINTYASLGANF